jgi:hypothetical protein
MAKNKDREKSLKIGKFSISTKKSKNEYGKDKKLSIKVGDKEVYSRDKSKYKTEKTAPFKAKNVNSISSDYDVKFSKRKSMPSRMIADNLGLENETDLNLTSKRGKIKSSKLDLKKVSLERNKEKTGRLKQDYSVDKTGLWVGGGKSVPRTKLKDKTINYSNPEKGIDTNISRSKQKGTVKVKSSNFGSRNWSRDLRRKKVTYYPEAKVFQETGKSKSANGKEYKEKTKLKFR